MAHIRKMRANTDERETLVIEDISLSTKAIIDKDKTDVNIKILWVLQQANIRQIVADKKRPMILWDKKNLMYKQKVDND